MKRSGTADLPLHYGKVPPWLYQRMRKLGGAIVEAIVLLAVMLFEAVNKTIYSIEKSTYL